MMPYEETFVFVRSGQADMSACTYNSYVPVNSPGQEGLHRCIKIYLQLFQRRFTTSYANSCIPVRKKNECPCRIPIKAQYNATMAICQTASGKLEGAIHFPLGHPRDIILHSRMPAICRLWIYRGLIIMAKKKPPTRTLKKESRIAKAKSWLPTYEGKKVVRAYRKKFHVDIACAARELQEIGYEFQPGYVENLLRSEAARIEQLHRKKEEKRLTEECHDDWQDGYFYYIAGYTSSGAPFPKSAGCF